MEQNKEMQREQKVRNCVIDGKFSLSSRQTQQLDLLASEPLQEQNGGSAGVSFQVLPLFCEQPEQIAQRPVPEQIAISNEDLALQRELQTQTENVAVAPRSLLESNAVPEHEAFLENPELFYRRLREFHDCRQTRLTVPNIRGRELDVFAFYKLMTSWGGLHQVIRDKRWNEVAAALGVPCLVPNVSYFLRKHYSDMLYEFEQRYYCRTYGQQSYPIGVLPAPSPVVQANDDVAYEMPVNRASSIKKRKKKGDLVQLFGVDPGASVGHCVTGAINYKFESGYVVTVVVGSEKLSGILYHVPMENTGPQFAAVPGLINRTGSELNGSGLELPVSKKRRESTIKKDPNAPRQSRSGYNYFYADQCAKFKENHPEFDRETSKVVADMWNNLSAEEKQPYIERSEQDKKRYRREMAEYKKRQSIETNDAHVREHNVDTIVKGNEGPDINSYYQDGRNDYHVSLETDVDMTPFQSHQHQEVGVSTTDDQMYSNQDEGDVYPVLVPVAQSSEYQMVNTDSRPQTYGALTDNYTYQTGTVPSHENHRNPSFAMPTEQVQWGQQEDNAFHVQDT